MCCELIVIGLVEAQAPLAVILRKKMKKMGFSLFRRVAAERVFRSSVGARRTMSSLGSDKYHTYLMVPPFFDDCGNLLNNFHRIGSEERISLPLKTSDGRGVEVVGMSKGWLALHNRASHDTFILNPMSGRRIELPHLPDPQRMVLDSCPDQSDDVRAVAIFGGGKRLASCAPGRSKEWTPCVDDGDFVGGEEYEDVTHARLENLFCCVTKNPTAVEFWDVRGPGPPRLSSRFRGAERVKAEYWERSYWLDLDRNDFPWPYRSQQDWEVKRKKLSWRIKYVVESYGDGGVYVVVRHVLPARPYKTFDFDVYSLGFGTDARYMKANLKGKSLLLGNNESSVVPLDQNLKPNCIYFTDDSRLMRLSRSLGYGGHDNGIFDYRNNAFSTCCGEGNCPLGNSHIHKIHPAPLFWFR